MKPLLLTPAQQRELFAALDILEAGGIRYALWSGAQASLLAGHRATQDIDLWVHDEDIMAVPALFGRGARRLVAHDRVIVRLGAAGEVECMARMDIHTTAGMYPLRMSPLAAANRTTLSVAGRPVRCANPADTVLLKAILQRGPDIGKHDFEDIAAVCRHAGIDAWYLAQRIGESGAAYRVADVLAAHVPGLARHVEQPALPAARVALAV